MKRISLLIVTILTGILQGCSEVNDATMPLSSSARNMLYQNAVVVKTPTDNSNVISGFTLQASSNTCSSEPVVSMGYSIDYSATTVFNTNYPGSVGTGPEANPNKNVCGGNYWQKWPDVNSHGTMDLTQGLSHLLKDGRPSAMFTLIHNQYGDILNHIGLNGSNPNFRNFIWDAWIKIVNVKGINALEMGLNHSAVGTTASFAGVQCDFQSSKMWDVNGIGPGVWTPTTAPCDIKKWESTWHHIKLAMHEDSNMTSYVDAIYDATLDGNGKEQPTIYIIGMPGSPQSIQGYPAGLITAKFQHDGGPNGITSYQYLSNLQISAW